MAKPLSKQKDDKIVMTPRPIISNTEPKSESDPSFGGSGLLKSIENVTFDSTFDSANLKDVRLNGDGEYELYIAKDCDGTSYQTRNSSWFHFRVIGAVSGILKFRIKNMNRQPALYRQGFKPVVKSLPSKPKWEHLKTNISILDIKEEGIYEISWSYMISKPDEMIYFAFTFPYGYDECQEGLIERDLALGVAHYPTCNAETGEWDKWKKPEGETDRDVFYYRQLLTRSLDGRRIDLVTISDWSDLFDQDSHDTGSTDSMTGLCETMDHMTDLHPSVFPEVRSRSKPHPPRFSSKRVVFLTARVHPGETPASHCLNGSLGFLLDPHDQRAITLRRHFVFKIIPMLNPDGVARGHYRQDNHGDNLNRFYEDPSPLRQPTIYAAKMAVCMYSFTPSNSNFLAHFASPNDNKLEQGSSGVAFYLDMHAHATKRGCFIYGNSLPTLTDQVENQLYAQLLALNSTHFEYDACNFSKKHMERVDSSDGTSAEGSGRVAMHKATGMIHSYTLECNYNTGKVLNHVPAAQNCQGRASPERQKTGPPKYTIEDWAEVGRGVLASLLDLFDLNPWSRVGNSKYRQVDKVRHAVFSDIRNQKEYQKQSMNSRRNSYLRSQSAPEPGHGIVDNGKVSQTMEGGVIVFDMTSRKKKEGGTGSSAWSLASCRFKEGQPKHTRSQLKEEATSNNQSSSRSSNQPQSSSGGTRTLVGSRSQGQSQGQSQGHKLAGQSRENGGPTHKRRSSMGSESVEKNSPPLLSSQPAPKARSNPNTSRQDVRQNSGPAAEKTTKASIRKQDGTYRMKDRGNKVVDKGASTQQSQSIRDTISQQQESNSSRRKYGTHLTQLSQLKLSDKSDGRAHQKSSNTLLLSNNQSMIGASSHHLSPQHSQGGLQQGVMRIEGQQSSQSDRSKAEALRLASYARAQQLKKIASTSHSQVHSYGTQPQSQQSTLALPQVVARQ